MSFFIHSSSIAEPGCSIGDGTKIWHFSHVMPSAMIGENCNIGQNVFIGDGVSLGNNVKVQNNVSVYEGVVCEDDVFLGPSCVFTNIKNPRSAIVRKGQYEKTLVGKGATIGANATVVCGTQIGKYAFIGAGTVVTKDVPDYALIVGNPGKIDGYMSQFGHRLRFHDEEATCPESGDVYVMKGNIVSLKGS